MLVQPANAKQGFSCVAQKAGWLGIADKLVKITENFIHYPHFSRSKIDGQYLAT